MFCSTTVLSFATRQHVRKFCDKESCREDAVSGLAHELQADVIIGFGKRSYPGGVPVLTHVTLFNYQFLAQSYFFYHISLVVIKD